ncbi:Hypothetical_protein [Hexamita inflata]|uniref:Hypothetical_protein n=1 Tax=Hexamita inflata TaxID=28002 RepID=A0AA86P9D2_9EUKA|nr:Hypothetical protein HINF_LOCUS21898 [Hexamita inflata]
MIVHYVANAQEHANYVASAVVTERQDHQTQISAGQFNLEAHVRVQNDIASQLEQNAIQNQRKPKRVIPPENQRRTYKLGELVLLQSQFKEMQKTLIYGQRQKDVDEHIATLLRMSTSSVKTYRLKHIAGIDITIIKQRGPPRKLKETHLNQIVQNVRADMTLREAALEVNIQHEKDNHPEWTIDQQKQAAQLVPFVSPTTVYNALKNKQQLNKLFVYPCINPEQIIICQKYIVLIFMCTTHQFKLQIMVVDSYKYLKIVQ